MSKLPQIYDLEAYDFFVPSDQIAQDPPSQRFRSKMLVFDRKTNQIADKSFFDIVDIIPAGALIIANDTKVLSARLFGQKKTGGKVEFLLLTPFPLISPQLIGGLKRAEVKGLLRASKQIKIGEKIEFADNFWIEMKQAHEFGNSIVELCWEGELQDLFEKFGHMPLPPYIQRNDKIDDKNRYQTVYANSTKLGAVAAPTAGLHFTPEIREKLLQKGVQWGNVTLYVGYGTFSPIRVRDIRTHEMHAEYGEISGVTAQLIKLAKQEGRPIIAIGTTSTRILESMYKYTGGIHEFSGWTDIFISPGYKFEIVDALLTNFHLPKSSLVVMVSALAGFEEVKKIYAHAIKNKYRFFSYGDAMLIK